MNAFATRSSFLRGAISAALLLPGCAESPSERKAAQDSTSPKPSILFVTLDTTRADAVGAATPSFNSLAARGRRFLRAYATVPETLPSHSSMMTGLYPAGHGVHENARSLDSAHPRIAEVLQKSGYRTAAFVSSFVLARRFGLDRGFDAYDDVEKAERTAKETTDRALEFLKDRKDAPVFLWVHYFDAHAPYLPKEPFKSRYPKNPYLGEVAAVDEQLGRLVAAFETGAAGRPVAIVIAGDHGEGLGDHGESQHGHLLYESTMRVPLVVVGPGVSAEAIDTPVSTRRVFPTLLDLAGLGAKDSLRAASPAEVVLGEAMKPYLEYGWLPQVMAVDGASKTISAGRTEVYDVVKDPEESDDLASQVTVSRSTRTALQEYPIPSLASAAAASSASLSDEDRKKLASLGYVSASAAPVVRKDAPRPVDMVFLFDTIEKASGLFVGGEYLKAIPLLDRILAKDPRNLDAALRLATAHSALGHEAAAGRMFDRAKDIAPESKDVRTYLALHLARGTRWEEAGKMLERSETEDPTRLPVLEALARIRERQGRTRDAIAFWRKIHALRQPEAAELVHLGSLAMNAEDTPLALEAFAAARNLQGNAFAHDLELGVLFLASRRYEDARQALDRVPARDPGYPMALFKRAQVSVLLHEPDQAARIDLARRKADGTTRELIANERLFLSSSARPQ